MKFIYTKLSKLNKQTSKWINKPQCIIRHSIEPNQYNIKSREYSTSNWILCLCLCVCVKCVAKVSFRSKLISYWGFIIVPLWIISIIIVPAIRTIYVYPKCQQCQNYRVFQLLMAQYITINIILIILHGFYAN